MMIDRHLRYKKIGFENHDEYNDVSAFITAEEEKIYMKRGILDSLSKQIVELKRENEDSLEALKVKDDYYRKIIAEEKNKINEKMCNKRADKDILIAVLALVVTLLAIGIIYMFTYTSYLC